MRVPKQRSRGKGFGFRCSTEFIIRPDGNVEINHPSFVTLRIALSLDPENVNLQKLVKLNEELVETFGEKWAYHELFCG